MKNVYIYSKYKKETFLYYSLDGECELYGELSLVGIMINKAEINYNDRTLSVKIYESDY
ncbi:MULTISPECIES: hypothetical protein [unclassified Clostridium]|uniref:hypothetical protein n=1 Tax=unclassified Clostridium TaxID=2614128 RepID=UPI001897137F|nr:MULTISPECIES: hypothetical protein [unclassified Clostridium]MCR1952765.1 hypothetical protein [Clostridium sp. DSM 100503]